MNRKAIILTFEEWDRLIEVLDIVHLTHPDILHLLQRINNQLLPGTETMKQENLTLVPDEKNPNRMKVVRQP